MTHTDPGHEPPDEELLQPRLRSARRPVVVIAILAAAAVAVLAIVVRTRPDTPRALPSARPTPTLSIPANPTSPPEQDALPALNRCGGDCVTYSLSRTVLQRTGLRGLTSAFGVRVTDGRREQLRSITGRVAGAQVRLLYERVALSDAALRVTDSMGPNRTVVLAVIRHGWRLTAVLLGAQPPTAAATAWARSAPLPR